MTAYYNAFDKQTAAWLRELIKAGMIAPGVVDERSIEDVRPSDLDGFTQCHFFAGIGVWSYALRLAGWPDDRPVWTGSCPCQPFSAAGKGAGFADERHLWPAFHYLIQQRRPAIVLGEQVASAAVDDWIDLVHADLEALGYAFGSVPFPAAGVGAPHIRDRNYWAGIRMDDTNSTRLAGHGLRAENGSKYRIRSEAGSPGASGIDCGLAHDQLQQRQNGQPSFGLEHGASGWQQGSAAVAGLRSDSRTGSTDGFWRDAEWLHCRDGKWRPVEPGTFPLVTGADARVVRLRGYGNAVNAEQARAWIETVMAY